jgi:hypothetical protein
MVYTNQIYRPVWRPLNVVAVHAHVQKGRLLRKPIGWILHKFLRRHLGLEVRYVEFSIGDGLRIRQTGPDQVLERRRLRRCAGNVKTLSLLQLLGLVGTLLNADLR